MLGLFSDSAQKRWGKLRNSLSLTDLTTIGQGSGSSKLKATTKVKRNQSVRVNPVTRPYSPIVPQSNFIKELENVLEQRKFRTKDNPGKLLASDQLQRGLAQTPDWKEYKRGERLFYYNDKLSISSWKPPRQSKMAEATEPVAGNVDDKSTLLSAKLQWRHSDQKKWTQSFLELTASSLKINLDDGKHSSRGKYLVIDCVRCEISEEVGKKGYRLHLDSKPSSITIKFEKKSEFEIWKSSLLQTVSCDGSASSKSKTFLGGESPKKLPNMEEPVELREKNEEIKTKAAKRQSGLSRAPSKRSKYLSKFLKRRPTQEELKAIGIIKDNAVFGCPLEKQEFQGSTEIPLFLWRCIEKLESHDDNLRMEGLYRVSGDAVVIQRIRLEIDQNKWTTFDGTTDVHILSGCLKQFLRELPEPVIPYFLHEPLHQAIQQEQSLHNIFDSLSDQIKATLGVMLNHLVKVSKHSENKMGLDNLAMVFGQVLLWPDPSAPCNLALASEMARNVKIIHKILDECSAIFPATTYSLEALT